MTYNYTFDIASIFIFAVILITYLQQNFIKNLTHKLYILLWIMAFITPVADIFSCAAINNHYPITYQISNSIYYEAQVLTAFFFFLYAISPLARPEKISKFKYCLFTIPLIVATGLIGTNFITNAVFYIDEATGIYLWGPYNWVVYVPSLLYLAYSAYFPLKNYKYYDLHMRYALCNILILMCGSVVFQYFMPHIMFRSFAISLCMLQLLIVTIKQHPTQSVESGLLSHEAFYNTANMLIYNNIPFNVIAIRVPDYEMILATYGKKNVHDLELAICKNIMPLAPKNNSFHVDDDMICMIFEKQCLQDNILIQHQLDHRLADKWSINGLDISFSHLITSFEYGRDFTDEMGLHRLMVYMEKTRRQRYGILATEELSLRNLHRESEVEAAIIDALANNRFEMYYQPIYSTLHGSFTCSEALIRLNNSSIGFIGPDEFIPIAEKTGLMIQIGDFVLDDVFKFIKSHDLKALGVDYIEINLSTLQCLQRNFIQNLFEKVKAFDIDPSQVCFEITETASNCSPAVFSQNLQDLHNAGFKLAIDDFGTGYGNLSRLISSDFDIVKFDKDTTGQICSDEKIRPIFAKMNKMLHSMGCSIVAEGIETLEQNDFLTDIVTDYIQGYYYSKPVPGDEYVKFLEENNVMSMTS